MVTLHLTDHGVVLGVLLELKDREGVWVFVTVLELVGVGEVPAAPEGDTVAVDDPVPLRLLDTDGDIVCVSEGDRVFDGDTEELSVLPSVTSTTCGLPSPRKRLPMPFVTPPGQVDEENPQVLVISDIVGIAEVNVTFTVMEVSPTGISTVIRQLSAPPWRVYL